MNNSYAKAYLTTLYLLGERGQEVQLPSEPEQESAVPKELQLLQRGLASEDRHVRAQWLARGMQDLLSELRDRQLS